MDSPLPLKLVSCRSRTMLTPFSPLNCTSLRAHWHCCRNSRFSPGTAPLVRALLRPCTAHYHINGPHTRTTRSVSVFEAEPWVQQACSLLAEQALCGREGAQGCRCRLSRACCSHGAACPHPRPSTLSVTWRRLRQGTRATQNESGPQHSMAARAVTLPVLSVCHELPHLLPQHVYLPTLAPYRHPDSPAQQRQDGRRQEGCAVSPAFQHHDCASHQRTQGAQRQQRSGYLQAAGCGTVGGGGGPGLATSRSQHRTPPGCLPLDPVCAWVCGPPTGAEPVAVPPPPPSALKIVMLPGTSPPTSLPTHVALSMCREDLRQQAEGWRHDLAQAGKQGEKQACTQATRRAALRGRHPLPFRCRSSLSGPRALPCRLAPS